MILLIFLGSTSIEDITEHLFFSVAQTCYVCKLLIFIFQKKNILKLEKILKQEILSCLSLDEEQLLMDLVKVIRIGAVIFRIFCGVNVVFFGVCALINKDKDGNMGMPVPLYVPFNPQNYYFTVFFLSELSLAVGAWTNSNLDILTVMLVTLGIGQMEILKNRFENVVQTFKEEEIIERKLKNYAMHLNEIYR